MANEFYFDFDSINWGYIDTKPGVKDPIANDPPADLSRVPRLGGDHSLDEIKAILRNEKLAALRNKRDEADKSRDRMRNARRSLPLSMRHGGARYSPASAGHVWRRGFSQ